MSGVEADDLIEQVARDFSPDSALAASFDGYRPRREQIRLAKAIAGCLQQSHSLIAEAETGTGKTLAYLLPALRSRRKILISTHTRALQDQLMHRDLPAVRKATGLRRSVALIKGRRNYLCPERLQRWLTSTRLQRHHYRPLLRVRDWAEQTRDGDLGELPFDPFEKGIGAMITATAEQCLGGQCEHWSACPLMRARLRAQEADIVIANHSLLLADAALKSGDFGAVLPEFDAYVLDEAHSLPQVATQHFGVSLGRMRLIAWLNDTEQALEALGDEAALQRQIRQAGEDLLKLWGAPLETLERAWRALGSSIEDRRERGVALAHLAERAERILEDIRFLQRPGKEYVAWQDGDGDSLRYQALPIDSGPLLRQHLWSRDAAFVLLSATLRLSGSFAHARERLGLPPDVQESVHPSPFDYTRQALNYLPRHLPDPRQPTAQLALLDEMEALLLASRGRAFVLFTSWQSLQCMAPELARRLPWRVWIQGMDGSREHILQAFREDTHSVLCGTRSFWEGVDVPGAGLSLVVIEKMPFASPGDPWMRARIERCEAEGGNGFFDILLPEAIAVLRQGVGRLIRDARDCGVMAILDSRLHHKPYGREVARNLPPARITDDIADVRWFFEEEE